MGDAFLELARAQALALEYPDARLAVLEHPLAGNPPELVRSKGIALVDDVIAALVGVKGEPVPVPSP